MFLGRFGHRRFGLDILATDISATENAKGGHFGHSHKFWVWNVCMCKCVMCDAFLNFLKSNMYVNTYSRFKMRDNRIMLVFIETGKLCCKLYSSKYKVPITRP